MDLRSQKIRHDKGDLSCLSPPSINQPIGQPVSLSQSPLLDILAKSFYHLVCYSFCSQSVNICARLILSSSVWPVVFVCTCSSNIMFLHFSVEAITEKIL